MHGSYFAALALILHTRASIWKCTSNASCQLNGFCVGGRCNCDSQWVGLNCSQLNTGASKAAYTGMAENQSTWGGHPIYDEKTNLWHGYFTELTNQCTLDHWTTNSIIVHATSPNVDGPFDFKAVVQKAWSHNPMVTTDPKNGDILIAHIGCGIIAQGMAPFNCSNPQEAAYRRLQNYAADRLPPCECPNYGAKDPPHISCQTLQILRSATPDGPFVDETVEWPLVNTSRWPSILSNPTLLFPENHGDKVLLGFNGNLAPPDNNQNTSHLGLLVSQTDSWRGPYDLVNVSVPDKVSGEIRHFLDSHGAAEDPVLFRDERGYLHVLFHGFYDLFAGGHGWTTDLTGHTGWEFSASAAYDKTVYLGGVTIELDLQRPQVVLQDGKIVALFRGARPGSQQRINGGKTFNIVTEVCSKGPAVGGRCPT